MLVVIEVIFNINIFDIFNISYCYKVNLIEIMLSYLFFNK